MEGANVTEETNNSTASLVYQQMALTLRNVRFWWDVFIVPVGITVNILCTLVMSQKHNRSISCNVYITALAVCDITYHATNGCYMFFNGAFGFKQGIIFCKVIFFSLFASGRCGVMIIVALLVERTIAVTSPMKAAFLLSPKRATIVVLVIVFLTVIFNLLYIISASRMQGGLCIAIGSDSLFYVIHNMIAIFLYGLIPWAGIFLLNSIILFTIKSSKIAFGKQRKAGIYAKNVATVSNSDSQNTSSKGLEFSTDVATATSAVDNNIIVEMVSPMQKKYESENHASITRVSDDVDNPVMEESETSADTGKK